MNVADDLIRARLLETKRLPKRVWSRWASPVDVTDLMPARVGSPSTYYHVADSTLVPEILKHGLKPQKATSSNIGNGWVFLHTKPSTVNYHLRHQLVTKRGAQTVLAVDAAGVDRARLVGDHLYSDDHDAGAVAHWGRIAPEHISRVAHLGEAEDWRGMHQPSMGPPIHNMLGPDADGSPPIAPNDIYDRMHEYAGNEKHDHESMDAIHRARHDRPLSKRPAAPAQTIGGVPSLGMEPIHIAARPEESDESLERRRERRRNGDHKVEIHRAAPHGAHTLTDGDWVTPSKSYALLHRKEHDTDRTRDMPVYTAKVPAKHVRWAGDDLNEFGYNGPPVRMKVSTRGGKNARRVTP